MSNSHFILFILFHSILLSSLFLPFYSHVLIFIFLFYPGHVSFLLSFYSYFIYLLHFPVSYFLMFTFSYLLCPCGYTYISFVLTYCLYIILVFSTSCVIPNLTKLKKAKLKVKKTENHVLMFSCLYIYLC
jgi:hypothetical protein